jgi:hypothetical protein
MENPTYEAQLVYMVLQVRESGEHRDMAREEWVHRNGLDAIRRGGIIILHESVEWCRRAKGQWRDEGSCVTKDAIFAFRGRTMDQSIPIAR